MTIVDVNVQSPAEDAALTGVVDDELVARLAGQARAQGVSLVGEGGLLQQLTKRVLEAALEGEMDFASGLWPARARWWERQRPQRSPVQDGADRGRSGGAGRAAGPGRFVHSADRA
jgi:hypothetical protein